jgi:ABC-type branched-subunit amino acid transport system ATPase component/predicted MFS family arabinose efflux permease
MKKFVYKHWPWLEGREIYPLGLLLILNAVDEFDVNAFTTLAPEISEAFGLSDTQYGIIVALTTVLILLGGLPIGFIGDRLPRVRLVVLAAILWASMSITTGLAPVLWVLIIARLGSGFGRVANEAIHTSLLTDYYPQHIQGRIFGIHRLGNPAGRVLGSFAAGAIAAPWFLGDWRWAFFIVSIPTFIVAFFALKLREPIKGEAEDSNLALEAEKESPIPFGRGWRWLFSVPSLKRFYISAFFGGGVIFALTGFLALFFEREFGVNEFGRGLINAGNGLAQFAGTVLGAIFADRMRRIGLGKIAFIAGLAVAGIGVGVVIVGASPVLIGGIAGSLIAWASIGFWTPTHYSVFVIVLPARIRSLGIGIGVMFFGVGGFVFTILAGSVSDASGIRAAISTLAPGLFVAAAIYLAAARFVNDDGQRALQALALEVELRHERLSAGQQALLVCRGTDVAYDGVQVLFGVDFQVHQGEIVALLGTNGAGKSTLLRAISGINHPIGGAIFFEGENITYYEAAETARAGIAQVPGGRGVFPSLTVEENLELASWMFRKDRAFVKKTVDEVLEVFPILKERLETKAGNLSGGEQQMLTLAQAFIAKPKLLMIDELSLGLAPKLVDQLLESVKAMHERGITIILVEQSVNIALTVADKAYFMEKGEIRFSGPAAELLGRGDLIRSVFLEGAGRNGPRGRLSSSIKVDEPSRADLDEGVGQEDVAALRTIGLSASYGGIRAIDDVSLTLKPGAILGVIGPNGAGKTTLFDVISGFHRQDSGRIELLGEDISELPANERALRGLGRSFQDARLFPSLTVFDNIALGLDRHVEVREPVAAALGLPVVRTSEKRASERVEELIERMGLDAFRDKFVHELSTGSRRIVDLACSLAHEPKVLILDEPSSGIAQAETDALAPLLLRLREDLGCSLLVIEHDIPLVSSIADELIALDVGRVIARGTPKEVVRDPKVVISYLGTRDEVIARSGGLLGASPADSPNGRKRTAKKSTKRTPKKTRKSPKKKT